MDHHHHSKADAAAEWERLASGTDAPATATAAYTPFTTATVRDWLLDDWARPDVAAAVVGPVAEPAAPVQDLAVKPAPEDSDPATTTTTARSTSPPSLDQRALLRDRIWQLAAHVSASRSRIEADRHALAATVSSLRAHDLLDPDLEAAATAGVAQVLVTSGVDPDAVAWNVRVRSIQALAEQGAVSAAAAGAGGAAGLATASAVTAAITGRMLARGMVGPAALAGVAGVGMAPLAAGIALGGALAAGVYYGGTLWTARREVKALVPIVRQCRADRDQLLMLEVAVHQVRVALEGLLAVASSIGPDAAASLDLTGETLGRLQSVDLMALQAEAVAQLDAGAWVADAEHEIVTWRSVDEDVHAD
ncbi:hypothetical protein H9P43_008433 [Blastocladiella emersonii ATCC 22665]|nr:hypothetical protein H9P43_008433 [Blastocladiella emersonii ATCC 22665]